MVLFIAHLDLSVLTAQIGSIGIRGRTICRGMIDLALVYSNGNVANGNAIGRHVRVHHVDKDKDDPALRDVLSQRQEGTTGRKIRRRAGTNTSV